MLPGSSLRFRLPRTTKKRSCERSSQSSEHLELLQTQLHLANAENSTLRKQISDQRDTSATQIHALRHQSASLQTRVHALFQESCSRKRDLDQTNDRHLLETANLRVQVESLKTQLVDAEQRKDIIKSAMKEITLQLSSITTLHAKAKHELTVVRREREAALDDACNIQNLLERERNHNQVKLCALHKEIIQLRKHDYFTNRVRIEFETPLKKPDNDTEIKHEQRHDRDDDPLTSDSLSTEILTPREETMKYHVLFNPQIPMTPIRALDNSEYVVNGDSFDSIRPSAFATTELGTPKLDFQMVLNEPFSAWGSAERPTMMYIGFEYPDGTSLCYAPIRDILVKHPSIRDSPDQPHRDKDRDHSLGADYGRDYVRLCLREVLYLALVEQAKHVFATRYSTETVELPRVSYEKPMKNSARMVSITASMKPDARVETKVNGCIQNTFLSNQLLDNRDDIIGDALLAMRFSKAYPNEAGYMLGFKLHGIFVGTR